MSAPEDIDVTRVLCRVAELEGRCREFRLGTGDWPLRGFVVQVGDEVRAYVNRCAHLNYPLNYMPDQFLSPDGSVIQCFVHGAIFDKSTGYCIAGPCSGLSLITLPVHIQQGYVLLSNEVDPNELAQRYA
jgi:nitrite reductase/ring-hydroxylating ferredoxin subunit